jgi:hypothetical protein
MRNRNRTWPTDERRCLPETSSQAKRPGRIEPSFRFYEGKLAWARLRDRWRSTAALATATQTLNKVQDDGRGCLRRSDSDQRYIRDVGETVEALCGIRRIDEADLTQGVRQKRGVGIGGEANDIESVPKNPRARPPRRR